MRELGNAIARAVILCDGPAIEPEHRAIPQSGAAAPGAAAATAAGAGQSLDDYFRNFVIANQNTMTESELARALGISRKTLWERRGKMNLPRSR